MNDVEKARPDETGDEDIESGTVDMLWVGIQGSADTFDDVDGGEETNDNHKAVTFYGQVRERQFKKFRMHILAYSGQRIEKYWLSAFYNFVVFAENDDFWLKFFSLRRGHQSKGQYDNKVAGFNQFSGGPHDDDVA